MMPSRLFLSWCQTHLHNLLSSFQHRAVERQPTFLDAPTQIGFGHVIRVHVCHVLQRTHYIPAVGTKLAYLSGGAHVFVCSLRLKAIAALHHPPICSRCGHTELLGEAAANTS